MLYYLGRQDNPGYISISIYIYQAIARIHINTLRKGEGEGNSKKHWPSTRLTIYHVYIIEASLFIYFAAIKECYNYVTSTLCAGDLEQWYSLFRLLKWPSRPVKILLPVVVLFGPNFGVASPPHIKKLARLWKGNKGIGKVLRAGMDAHS